MNGLVVAAASAALALTFHAGPAAAQPELTDAPGDRVEAAPAAPTKGAAAPQEALAPPPGYVLVPAPPPGYTLEAVPVERTWAIGAFLGSDFQDSRTRSSETARGVYADLFVRPRLSVGLFADQRSTAFSDVTSLGASVTTHFFGGARSTHLRAGLGVSHDQSSGTLARWNGGRPQAGLRAFLGGVLRLSDRASVFVQGTAQTDLNGEGGEGTWLSVGLELGN